MKKVFTFSFIITTALLLANCGSSKKAATASGATFSKEVTTVLHSHCAPCHIPSKGGKKTAYDVYENVKADIDDIIRRVELNPGQKGFMPMRGEKLDDASIAILKRWKEEGMNE